jgi:uncharacterized protein YndB with AHSA1/START domain
MASTYSVERSVTVDADPAHVFAQVVDLHRWTAWSPWEELDPALRRSYSGPDAGPGSTYEWSGNRKAGQGRMQITSVDEPHTIVVDLAFLKPFKSTSTTTFTFAPVAGQTQVTWSMTGANTAMTKVMGIFTSMDKLVGPDFEKGLARLKTVSEAPSPG